MQSRKNRPHGYEQIRGAGFFERTGFHGFRYIMDRSLPVWQRVIWGILVAMAICGVFFVSNVLTYRYNLNVMTTVIDNPYYPVWRIPFPAVTLCNFKRIDMSRFEESAKRFIPNATNETRETFKELLAKLSFLANGWFHKLAPLAKNNHRQLDFLNISEVYQFAMYKCADLFVNCWWNNREFDCCGMFTLQRNEYGFCYSFNSQLSAVSNFQKEQFSRHNWPMTTNRHGLGSGLRVIFNLNRDPILDKKFYFSNIQNNSRMRYFSGMKKTDEVEGIPYLFSKCKADFRQREMVNRCNCSVDFFYPDFNQTGKFIPCNVTGLICLADFNDDIFSEKPPENSHYFSANEKGIRYMCLPECHRIEYGLSMKENLNWETQNDSLINVNVFFNSHGLMKYRTDATLPFLNVIIKFGGIVAFFFGASFLSVIEIIYYVIAYVVKNMSQKKISARRIRVEQQNLFEQSNNI